MLDSFFDDCVDEGSIRRQNVPTLKIGSNALVHNKGNVKHEDLKDITISSREQIVPGKVMTHNKDDRKLKFRPKLHSIKIENKARLNKSKKRRLIKDTRLSSQKYSDSFISIVQLSKESTRERVVGAKYTLNGLTPYQEAVNKRSKSSRPTMSIKESKRNS